MEDGAFNRLILIFKNLMDCYDYFPFFCSSFFFFLPHKSHAQQQRQEKEKMTYSLFATTKALTCIYIKRVVDKLKRE